jgi:hypothetical protein
VCSVKVFFEILSEEYPAPVCNDCCIPMLVRTEVIRAEEGSSEHRLFLRSDRQKCAAIGTLRQLPVLLA